MALPTTIVSFSGRSGHHPAFKSSAGDFYAIAIKSAFLISAYKATDPTDSWTETGTARSVGGSDSLTIVQSGDKLHVAWWNGSIVKNYRYARFDMDSDSWGVSAETIDTPTDEPTLPWISIAVRSDGDVIVVYAGDTDQVMGGKKERVDVNIRTGGTWGGPVALDAAGDIHYGNPNLVKGPLTDDMHILWQQTTNTADPPTAWEGFEARTLDSANVLSTKVTDTLDTAGALLGMNNGVSYDDGGTQRILFAGISGASGRARIYAIATEDGSDDIAFGTFVSDTAGADGHVNGEVGITTIAELNGAIHQLYSGGGTDGVDQDLHHTTSTDDGATWSTPDEEIDAITVNFISANIYVRGADTVMAYIYDDGGVQKYNEKVIVAGAAPLQQTQMLI